MIEIGSLIKLFKLMGKFNLVASNDLSCYPVAI